MECKTIVLMLALIGFFSLNERLLYAADGPTPFTQVRWESSNDYDVLGLQATAKELTDETTAFRYLKDAYTRATHLTYPDKNPGISGMAVQRVQESYKRLKSSYTTLFALLKANGKTTTKRTNTVEVEIVEPEPKAKPEPEPESDVPLTSLEQALGGSFRVVLFRDSNGRYNVRHPWVRHYPMRRRGYGVRSTNPPEHFIFDEDYPANLGISVGAVQKHRSQRVSWVSLSLVNGNISAKLGPEVSERGIEIEERSPSLKLKEGMVFEFKNIYRYEILATFGEYIVYRGWYRHTDPELQSPERISVDAADWFLPTLRELRRIHAVGEFDYASRAKESYAHNWPLTAEYGLAVHQNYLGQVEDFAVFPLEFRYSGPLYPLGGREEYSRVHREGSPPGHWPLRIKDTDMYRPFLAAKSSEPRLHVFHEFVQGGILFRKVPFMSDHYTGYYGHGSDWMHAAFYLAPPDTLPPLGTQVRGLKIVAYYGAQENSYSVVFDEITGEFSVHRTKLLLDPSEPPLQQPQISAYSAEPRTCADWITSRWRRSVNFVKGAF